MTQALSLNSRLAACLGYIPRGAKRIALLGSDAARIGQGFVHLAPDCSQTRFPNARRFMEFVKNSETKDTKFDAILVLGQKSVKGYLQAILSGVRPFLTDDAVILLEVTSPFFHVRLDEKMGREGIGYSGKFMDGLPAKSRTYSVRIQQEIKQSGMTIDHVHRFEGSGFRAWLDARISEGSVGKDNRDAIIRVAQPAGFLFRLTARPAVQMRIQAHVLKPVGGVNDVRINEPLAALGTVPGVLTDAGRGGRIMQGPDDISKIFIWHRPILTTAQSLRSIQQLRAAGYLIVTEFDDHHHLWPEIAGNSFLSFAGVHAVQTTTEPLGNLFRKFNPEIGIFPNQLNLYPVRDLSAPSKVARIFYGALNREKDWRPIMPAINAALATFKSDFHFDVVMDRAFFDALETDKKSFSPQLSYADYRSHLQKADISLMPLQDTEFNRMKSDLKLIEAAGHGAVPVASSVVYAKSDPTDEFAVICDIPADYQNALEQLVNDGGYRLGRQQAARDYVQKHRLLGQHYMGRYSWLSGLVQRRAELDAALERRLQKLLPQ